MSEKAIVITLSSNHVKSGKSCVAARLAEVLKTAGFTDVVVSFPEDNIDKYTEEDISEVLYSIKNTTINIVDGGIISQFKDYRFRSDIHPECLLDVDYLRTRNRWSQALEDELIRLHKEGTPPNMNKFGVTKETQQDMIDALINLRNAVKKQNG